ncbi:UNVERIFIED_CONTAM: hypothetical protein Slati_4167600 [Sesamum latifolium]|uniref:Uncharacterized protein n=1 Tax=Sesamum latifolium TaxID=2727402 RepID=A0AAW2TAT2_9LAMI
MFPLLREISSERGSHTLWGVKSVREERLLPSDDFKSALVGGRALLGIETQLSDIQELPPNPSEYRAQSAEGIPPT